MSELNLDRELIRRMKLRMNPGACVDATIVKRCTDKLLQAPAYRREIGQQKQDFVLYDIPGLLGFKCRKRMTLWRILSMKWDDNDLTRVVDVFAEEDGRLLLTQNVGVYQQNLYYVNRCEPERFVRYLLERQALLHADHAETAEDLLLLLQDDFDRIFADSIVPDQPRWFSCLEMTPGKALQELQSL